MTDEFEIGFKTGVLWAKYYPAKLNLAKAKIGELKSQGKSDAEAIHELLSECLTGVATDGGQGPGMLSPDKRNT